MLFVMYILVTLGISPILAEETSYTRNVLQTTVNLNSQQRKYLETEYHITIVDFNIAKRIYSVITTPETNFQKLQQEPFVMHINKNVSVSITADSIDWGVKKIDSDEVWSETTGTGVVVAVLDTGVDINHTDLKRNLLQGYDFVNNDSNPQDDHGHGTHVAGIIAAAKNGSGVQGNAYNTKILPVKVLDEKGEGLLSDVIDGIYYAINKNVDVISISFGADYHSSLMQQAIKSAYSKEIVLVASAGNDYGEKCLYPAAYVEVICVMATDKIDNIADFSNIGGELSAPGVDILSTYLQNKYALLSGTSMSTPFVSAAAALLMSYCDTCTSKQITTAMQKSTKDLGKKGFDNIYGYGLINVANAIDYIDEAFTIFAVDDSIMQEFINFLIIMENFIGEATPE